MADKPIMRDDGLYTAKGNDWLISDGEFPFGDCDDQCTSEQSRLRLRRHWETRKTRVAVFKYWAEGRPGAK